MILAIDPAIVKPHVCAIGEHQRLTRVFEIKDDSIFDIIPANIQIVVEGLFPGKSALPLARSAGNIVGLLGRRMADARVISPKEWRTGLISGNSPKTKRYQDYLVYKKLLSILYEPERRILEDVLSYVVIRNTLKEHERAMDFIDATGILLYAMDRGKR